MSEDDKKNYCRITEHPGISECTAGMLWETCRFSKPHSFFFRCRYDHSVYEFRHCACEDAQNDAKGK